MKYASTVLILALLCLLVGCSTGGIGTAFVVTPNFMPPEGEAPLSVSATVEIEGGSSASTSGYDFIWTIPAIPSYQSTAPTFSYIFQMPGDYLVNISVTDKSTGKAVNAQRIVKVHPDVGELQVLLDFIYPDEDAEGKAPIGKAPMVVEMGAIATGGEPPYYYEWDFNSDGVNEGYGIDVDTYKGTFASQGTFEITARVTDSRDTTASASRYVHVLASNPIAVANALPNEGPVGLFGLFVIFSATGSYDPDGSIVLYEWDFDNDGEYDWSSPVTGSTSHGFTQPGNYYPTLRVTDNDGLTGLATTQVVVTF
jgi:PKD repeat protein